MMEITHDEEELTIELNNGRLEISLTDWFASHSISISLYSEEIQQLKQLLNEM